MKELEYHHQIEKIDAGTAKELFPQLSESVQVKAQASMDKGKMVLDAAKIRGGDTATHNAFPSGKPTATLLPSRENSFYDGQSVQQHVETLKSTSNILKVLNRLPYAALAALLFETVFLRNNFLDFFFGEEPTYRIYKEEIEEDPEGIAAEVISEWTVRLGIIFALAIATTVFTSNVKIS